MKKVLPLLCLALVACGSVPETRFYLLADMDGSPTKARPTDRPLIVLGRIVVPDYLRQSGLIVQTNEYEIRPANYHRWAEPLEAGLRRALAMELTEAMPRFRIEPEPRDSREMDYRLDVDVSYFHGNESGEVFLSGRWMAYDLDDDERVASSRFNFRDRIGAPGYASMVAAQAAQLEQLSLEVSTAFDAISGSAR